MNSYHYLIETHEILSQSSLSRRPKIGPWGPQRIRHQCHYWYKAHMTEGG
jgi:hypothetical protein